MSTQNLYPLASENWPEALEDVRLFLGKPLNIQKMMAHHPDLMSAWMPFRNHVVANSSLTSRQRELLILRTAHNCNSDYEWQHHVERGLMAGLDRNEIDRVKEGATALDWQTDESALLQAADDCHRECRITPTTLKQVCRHYSHQQQLDIAVTVGMYMTLAIIIKTWDVPMEID